jgi:4-amino-4-deoxy-L-arabinose transferase-like glycosyltransferase
VSTISSSLRELPPPLLVILFLGLAIRISFVALHQRPLISDEKEYDQLGYNIATEGSYSYEGRPTAYRPVGYPALVGLVYFVAGHQPVIVKLFQAVLDAIVPLILYLLLSGFSERSRLLAAAFWAFYPPAILYSNFLLSETGFTFLLALSILLFLRLDVQTKGLAFLIGLLFGMLALMKPSFLLFLALLPLIFFAARLPLRRPWWIALGALLLVAPWAVRNSLTFGDTTLSLNGGINLLIGNNPNATGAYNVGFPEDILKGARTEVDADRRAFQYATHYILSMPGSFVVNGVKKLAHLFESEGGVLVWTFSPDPEDTATRFSTKYASLPPALALAVNLPYFLLLLAGIVGFLAFPEPKLRWSFFVLLGAWLLAHGVFFGGSRFHFPLMPFFAAFAAWWLSYLSEGFRSLSNTRKVLAAAAIVALIALWTYEGIAIYSA